MKSSIWVVAMGIITLAPGATGQTNGWLKTPTASVMIGFISEPLKPKGATVDLTWEGDRLILEVQPDPVASVVLKGNPP